MLTLSRKLGETIVINGNVKVTVVRVQKGSVRIGIQAPKEVKITRPDRKQPTG